MNSNLVFYSGNYADEFDVNGFSVMSDTELKEYLDAAKRDFKRGTVEHNFGTNEFVQWESYDDFKSELAIFPITPKQAKFVLKMFGREYGVFPYFEGYEEEEA